MIFIRVSNKLPIEQVQEAWGLIPGFLDENDPRPASEQFDAAYIGGWRPQEGFKRPPGGLTLSYPGDPPMKALCVMLFRDEQIWLYPYAYVCIVKPDGSFEVCRMD